MENSICLHDVKKWKKVKGTVFECETSTDDHAVAGENYVGTCKKCGKQVSKFEPFKKAKKGGKHLGLRMR